MNVETRAREAAAGVLAAPYLDAEAGLRRLHRTARRRGTGKVIAAVAAVSVVVGLVQVPRDGDQALPPAQDADQPRNGRVVQADSGYWQADTAPPGPGGDRSYAWEAYDQVTGSFLYAAPSVPGRFWVVRPDRLITQVDCPATTACGRVEMAAFGPDVDSLTVPSADGRSLQVIGFDGIVRDELDISSVVRGGESLADLAWSPDASRLAVSTSSDRTSGCDGSGAVACVWTFARDGGVPVPSSSFAQSATLIHAEGQRSELRGLTWSPDGGTLALLAGSGMYCERRPPWPELVALRMLPGEPARAETLYVYVYEDEVAGNSCVVASDFDVAFPFAWSPDGRRVAVTDGSELVKLSAEDGEDLARHPATGPQGPLAWLAEP